MASENNNRGANQQSLEDLVKTVAELQEKVKAMEATSLARSVQQIQYPLDQVSQAIIASVVTVAGPRSIQLGGTKGFGVYYGSGTPNAVVKAAKGSLFLNYTGSSTSTRAYVNTDDNTAWTAITTAT